MVLSQSTLDFMGSIQSVLHWFTGAAYTGFPDQTSMTVENVFWCDFIYIVSIASEYYKYKEQIVLPGDLIM